MISMPSRVRRARTKAALSQSELARRIGVKRSAVTQWECVHGTTPSVDHMIQIASETGVCFEWLATGRGPNCPDSGGFEVALIMHDFAQDELESRVLTGLRRLPGRKREAAAQIIELLSR
jgi:transcriptional regulator with XRE-family HTH domain